MLLPRRHYSSGLLCGLVDRIVELHCIGFSMLTVGCWFRHLLWVSLRLVCKSNSMSGADLINACFRLYSISYFSLLLSLLCLNICISLCTQMSFLPGPSTAPVCVSLISNLCAILPVDHTYVRFSLMLGCGTCCL